MSEPIEGIGMAILHITVTGVDPDDKAIQERAAAALEAAGIEVYRMWVEVTPQPQSFDKFKIREG